jgi:hypothetical protein
MIPGNLTFIDFQWKGASSTEIAVVRASAGASVYHMYLVVDCNNNGVCTKTLPSAEWQTLGKNHAGQDVTFEVITDVDGTFTRSAPLTIKYSPERLVGALYYWAAAENTINRVSFGAEAATPFIVPSSSTAAASVTPNTDYECVSCHSVSRDGTTIAFGVAPHEGENIAGIQVAPTANPYAPTIVPTPGPTPYEAEVAHDWGGVNNVDRCQSGVLCATTSLGHNVALSPNGDLMAVNATEPPANWPSRLEIRRTDVADAVVASYPIGTSQVPGLWGVDKLAIHPEYSPDGTKMVVTLAENNGNLSAWANEAGSIAVVPVNADGTLGTPSVIAEASGDAFHFYPTWSPDSAYVAFMTAWSSSSLNNDDAVIHMVPATGTTTCPGAGCIELTRGTGYTASDAQGGDGTGSTWPKFAPFAQGASKNIYFITFTSRRKRGLTPSSDSQLWMFGVDTSVTPDPSYAPFWLPWQSIDAGSLAPYWTEALPCNADVGTGSCEGCLEVERCVVNPDDNSCSCEGLAGVK